MPDTTPEDRPSPTRPTPRRGRGVSLRRMAYERIEDLLNSGRLKPGQLISQRELVDLTGATLGAVREAVPRLEAEGLLKTVPKKGLMIPSLDVAFVRNAYQVRRMIELAAVPDMVARLDRAVVSEWLDWHRRHLRDILAQGGNADQATLDSLQRLDWTMHAQFVAAMGNELMDNLYRVTAIKIRMAVQSRLQVTSANAVRVLGEHIAVLEALDRRDAAQTAEALARHIDISLDLALGARRA